MANILVPPVNFPGVQILVTRRIRFNVIPLVQDLPDRENTAGEEIDIDLTATED